MSKNREIESFKPTRPTFSTSRLRVLFGQVWLSASWLVCIVPMAVVVGSACAFFLWSLDIATRTRFEHPWLLYLLPVAGLAVGLVYHYWGKSVEGGNNLLLEQIHEPGGGVPRRMAPLILFATVVTHLFGGSAGREGTAVQMGGSIAGGFGKMFGLERQHMRILLMTGVAAGFSAVFGTPLAGAVFALEVLMIGRMQYEALIPCLIAAVVGDWTCHAWGVGHTRYHIAYVSDMGVGSAEGMPFHIQPLLLAKVAVIGIASGLAGALFAETTHTLHGFFKKVCPYAPARPVIGGVLVIALVYLVGTREYLGLGVWSPNPGDVTISNLFDSSNIHYTAWAWKILFTALTLSCGYKGGEVTPLFFIGAALGNALSGAMGAPTDLFAALGFVAIFAGASNTPLASTIMGIELFGSTHAVYIAVACFLSYLCSGHSSIYLSQRVAVPKTEGGNIPLDTPLRDVREIQPTALHVALDGLRDRLAPMPDLSSSSSTHDLTTGESTMLYPHHVHPSEIGMIRIYMKPGERRKTNGIKEFFTSRPLYRELVLAAKKDGIMNAVAHHTHYGYSNYGDVRTHDPELLNAELTMCVELIDRREQLETFCRHHGDLLQNKVIIYKHMEHWEIHDKKLEEKEATPDEIKTEELK